MMIPDESDQSNPEPNVNDGDESTRREAARQERMELERAQLLTRVTGNTLSDMKSRVAFVLNHYPHTRNDDVVLTIQYWRLFHDEIVGEGNSISLENLRWLTRANSITRARAKIQNTYGLFVAEEGVRRRRLELSQEERERQGEDQPEIPLVTVYCDESGKTQNNLIVGSVWINDSYRVFSIYQALTNWKSERSIRYEFHFNELTRQRKADYIAFVEQAMAQTDVLGFKAAVVETTGIGTMPIEEAIYRLHYQLVLQGIGHETNTNRLELPRVISLIKDKDDASDLLRLVDLRQKLQRECHDRFEGRVEIQNVDQDDSHTNIFLQLADVFAGALSRVLNRDPAAARNQKDEFADEMLTQLGIAPDLSIDERRQDFVEIIRIR